MENKKELKPEEIISSNEGSIQEQINQLEGKMKSMEAEKQVMDAHRMKLEEELHRLRNELDKLRQPALLYSRVAALLPDGRIIVEVDGGYRKNIVNVVSEFSRDELHQGVFVALNQRTLAVIEVLPDETIDPSSPPGVGDV